MMPPPPPPPPLHLENGQYTPVPKNQPNFIVWLNILNTVTQLLLGAVAFVAFIGANRLSGSLKQHIYLCVIGYVILMSQAIFVISPSFWFGVLKFETKRKIHTILQILGSLLAITGSVIRIVNVEEHFQTTHGILGILALIFTCLSLFGGVINLFSMRNQTKITIKLIKTGHAFCGCITIMLAFLSLVFGFDKVAFRIFHFDTNANMMMALTSVAVVGTLIPAYVNIERRIKS